MKISLCGGCHHLWKYYKGKGMFTGGCFSGTVCGGEVVAIVDLDNAAQLIHKEALTLQPINYKLLKTTGECYAVEKVKLTKSL